MRDGRMHQTTVRFGPDLWAALEAECAQLGISAAQYLREAALARLAYTAGHRREPDYASAFAGGAATAEADAVAAFAGARDAQQLSSEHVLAASAVSSQSDLVRRRAREIRARSIRLRREIEEKAK
jgi:hypothetical protein